MQFPKVKDDDCIYRVGCKSAKYGVLCHRRSVVDGPQFEPSYWQQALDISSAKLAGAAFTDWVV